MSLNDYLNYKKQQETSKKFTLKPPQGLTNEEAMYIVTSISSIMPNCTLPQDKEFKALDNSTKRIFLAKLYERGPQVYDYAKSLFRRYIVNTNYYKNYPAYPYLKHVASDRNKIFNKARAYSESYYQYRTKNNTAANSTFKSENNFLIPICYLDYSRDWFKELQTMPKTQLYMNGEAKNISQISSEYRKAALSSCFTKKFKNKVFFFPIEAKDKDGNYYPLIKQIEITKKQQMDGYMISISVSAIPKGNNKYMHQILRIDSGGYHANSAPKSVKASCKTDKVFYPSSKRTENLRDPALNNQIPFILPKTNGMHIHLFSKESQFIYSKNPTTADAIGIEQLVDMWQNIDYFKENMAHPCLQQLISNENEDDVFSLVYKLWVMDNNLRSGNFSTTFIDNYLAERNITLGEEHMRDASQFLYTLEVLECMDKIVDLCLNINPTPIAFDDKDYVKGLYGEQSKVSAPQEFISNKGALEAQAVTPETTEEGEEDETDKADKYNYIGSDDTTM